MDILLIFNNNNNDNKEQTNKIISFKSVNYVFKDIDKFKF
jgi:hypothetical protein